MSTCPYIRAVIYVHQEYAVGRAVIAIANLKGGVGKTTSAITLAAVLGGQGKKTLVVDMDAQGNATSGLGVEPRGHDLAQALRSRSSLPLAQTETPGVDLCAGGFLLNDAEHDLRSRPGSDTRLKVSLDKTPGPWEFIFVDCPPGLGMMVVNAFVAATHVLIATEGSPWALDGMAELLETVEDVRQGGLNPSLKILGVLPCKCYPRQVVHREVMEELSEAFPGRVGPVIRETVVFREAAGNRAPVTQYAPKSHGSEDYVRAAKWLLKTLREEEEASS
jgi:chromosome partitioning protein